MPPARVVLEVPEAGPAMAYNAISGIQISSGNGEHSMRGRLGIGAAALLLCTIAATDRLKAQGPAPQGEQPPRGGQGGRRGGGGFVPGQTRPPADPAAIERGKTLYGIN